MDYEVRRSSGFICADLKPALSEPNEMGDVRPMFPYIPINLAVRVSLRDWAIPIRLQWGFWDYERAWGAEVHVLCFQARVSFDNLMVRRTPWQIMLRKGQR